MFEKRKLKFKRNDIVYPKIDLTTVSCCIKKGSKCRIIEEDPFFRSYDIELVSDPTQYILDVDENQLTTFIIKLLNGM